MGKKERSTSGGKGQRERAMSSEPNTGLDPMTLTS